MERCVVGISLKMSDLADCLWRDRAKGGCLTCCVRIV